MMNKRDFILNVLDAGGKPEGVPAAFFLHFDPVFHRGQAAIEKHLEYFHYTDMDFLKIQFEQPFPKLDLKSPSDWLQLPFFDLDFYENQLNVVSGLVKAAKKDAFVILTLYSPFMLTCNIAGAEVVARHIADAPEQYRVGIQRMTDSLMQFVQACIKAGVDGFYTSTQGGEAGRLPSMEAFDTCVRPYDLAVMEEINRKCSFNILHVCDYHLPYKDLRPFISYPGQVVNSSLDLVGKQLTPKEVADQFGRPFMGGLDRKTTFANRSSEQIRQSVLDVLDSAPDRFILGADCTVPGNTSWDDLKLAIQTAHTYRR
ncbi:MAG TPA: uroporphyrinogen decarboxylase family protein [Anaerolineaceae bacterium]